MASVRRSSTRASQVMPTNNSVVTSTAIRVTVSTVRSPGSAKIPNPQRTAAISIAQRQPSRYARATSPAEKRIGTRL